MKIVKATEQLKTEQLDSIAKILHSGGGIIYPTETCYGIGALATSEKGVGNVLRYKQRPEGKAISVAVRDRNMANKYVHINPTADNIYEKFLPGPITVISKSRGETDPRLQTEIGTLGIRIPDHTIPMQIIEYVGEGITATSANVSGGKTPYTIDDILENISDNKKKLVDLVIDYGKLPKRPPSIVIDTTTTQPEILRGEDSQGILRANRKPIGKWETNSEQATFGLAKKILKVIEERSRGDQAISILLSGELGAGKTHITKGFAKALGIDEIIKSPTFILERQYESKVKSFNTLFHYDLWRLEEAMVNKSPIDELIRDLGIKEATMDRNLIAIEWPEKLPKLVKTLLDLTPNVYSLEIDQIGKRERTFKLFKNHKL